jgi:glucan biosynthesis protein C
MLLGVAYHATYAWMPDIAPWYFVADASPVAGLRLVAGLLHAFRMELFFALSGFFSHLLLERRGPRLFLEERSRRLLIPFAVALPITIGLDVLLRQWSHDWALMSSQYRAGTDIRFGPLHLWFLMYVWAYCALASWLPSSVFVQRIFVRSLQCSPVLLLFAIPTSCSLLVHPENRPAAALWPMPWEFIYFGLFFAVGWNLWRFRHLTGHLSRHARWMLPAGVCLGAWVFSGPVQWQPLGHALSGVVAWLMTLGCLGLGLTMPGKSRPVLRFVVSASYWVYLVHYPMVLAWQLYFAQTSFPGLFEYTLTILLTLCLAFGSFTVVVWKTPLGPLLGVKADRNEKYCAVPAAQE